MFIFIFIRYKISCMTEILEKKSQDSKIMNKKCKKLYKIIMIWNRGFFNPFKDILCTK